MPRQPALEFAGKVIRNPGQDRLRELALKHTPCCTRTAHGSINKVARNKARMAKYTYVIDRNDQAERYSHGTIDPSRAQSLIEGQREYIEAKGEIIALEGYIGKGDKAVACEWRYTLEAANIAGMQQILAFPREQVESPEQLNAEFAPAFRIIYTPDFRPDMPGRQAIVVDLDNYVTYIMGADYFGESKKAALRMLAALHYQAGGLVMHAGAKTVENEAGKRTLGVLGLSGTGKTTTTFSKQGNTTRPVQDDMIVLWPGGKVGVTENGCFAKTFALLPEHEPIIHAGTCREEAWLENVYVDANQTPIFDKGRLSPKEVEAKREVLLATGADRKKLEDYVEGRVGDDEVFTDHATHPGWEFAAWSENGRSIIPMSCIEGAEDLDAIPPLHSLGILNRDEGSDAAMPGLVRFCDPLQATGFMMLGETSKTSAAGSERGKTRSPFTQPFFPFAHHRQAWRFSELASSFGDTQMWLMNTGFVGGDGPTAKRGDAIDIKIRHSSALLEALLSGSIRWVRDPDFGYEVVDLDAPENAELLAAVPAEILQPKRWFDAHDRSDDYATWVERIKAERRAFLTRYEVDPAIVAAVDGASDRKVA